jgi:hypothetical protein
MLFAVGEKLLMTHPGEPSQPLSDVGTKASRNSFFDFDDISPVGDCSTQSEKRNCHCSVIIDTAAGGHCAS